VGRGRLHGALGPGDSAPLAPGERRLRVVLARLGRRAGPPGRIPKRLWLWWRGPGAPDRAVLWRADVHRFDLEHPDRFGEQGPHWTTPRVRHPEPADRWTGLVLLAYAQLRRARPALPQRLVTRGTPANAPNPCGRAPGRPLGARSGPASRYPAHKKVARFRYRPSTHRKTPRSLKNRSAAHGLHRKLRRTSGTHQAGAMLRWLNTRANRCPTPASASSMQTRRAAARSGQPNWNALSGSEIGQASGPLTSTPTCPDSPYAWACSTAPAGRVRRPHQTWAGAGRSPQS
jgi:hypothetical protein